jgi:8-oxo-dGTP pyrophosphatase MutT (NUDIX family)
VTSVSGPPPAGPGRAVPAWLDRLAAAAAGMTFPDGMAPPASGGRRSAVLILFGEDVTGPDVLLIQRSPNLRRHAGQPAFPGGAIDPEDGGPVAAALREAAEEALVDPAGVDVLAVLPDLYIPRSGFAVTPVLAWWRQPGPVGPGDPGEVTAVRRVPVAELADPANRRRVRYPTGQTGLAFQAGDMLVWGFTGMLVDRLLTLGGWAVPWDSAQVTPLPLTATAAPAADRSASSPARPGDPSLKSRSRE